MVFGSKTKNRSRCSTRSLSKNFRSRSQRSWNYSGGEERAYKRKNCIKPEVQSQRRWKSFDPALANKALGSFRHNNRKTKQTILSSGSWKWETIPQESDILETQSLVWTSWNVRGRTVVRTGNQISFETQRTKLRKEENRLFQEVVNSTIWTLMNYFTYRF